MRKLLGMAALAAAFVAGPMTGPASAQTEITVQYAIPDIFKDVQEEIAKQFMAANPTIKVKFIQPAKEYEDATQQVLRNAVTGQLPTSPSRASTASASWPTATSRSRSTASSPPRRIGRARAMTARC